MTYADVYQDAPPLDVTLRRRLQGVPTARIADSGTNLFGFDGIGLVPGAALDTWMGGRAFTVSLPAVDNLVLRPALSMGIAGDVLCVSVGGRTHRAVLGDSIVEAAAEHGFVGVVVDGAVRDAATLHEAPIPVFARGVTPTRSTKLGPGAVRVPIPMGGQVVCQGDVVVGDADGVLVIPRHDIGVVLDAVTGTDTGGGERAGATVELRERGPVSRPGANP